MKKLVAAQVSRSGRTARTWNDETSRVELDIEKDALSLRFSLSSKGGGITDVKLMIGSEDFAAIASTMARADRGRATREMAATLACELAKQSDCDKVTIQKARDSVVKAAELAYNEAPDGRDHAERLTWDMVRELVRQLNSSDENESEDSDETESLTV